MVNTELKQGNCAEYESAIWVCGKQNRTKRFSTLASSDSALDLKSISSSSWLIDRISKAEARPFLSLVSSERYPSPNTHFSRASGLEEMARM
jgi:hypothetical protein